MKTRMWLAYHNDKQDVLKVISEAQGVTTE